MNRDFWQNKKVFLTGQTGFKGGFLATWLNSLGSQVTGYALPPNTTPSFFELTRLADRINSIYGDVRDLDALVVSVGKQQPEIIYHLAAQPLVRRSYLEPVSTLATNIMGTVNILEAARRTPSVRAVIVITTDKCYLNRGNRFYCGYREIDELGGRDIYSASKSSSEIVVAAYQHSFFRNSSTTVATARAGNCIGGGDWSEDRLVPDAIKSFSRSDQFVVRNPRAVRPWQHVIEPLAGYLRLAEKVYLEQQNLEGGWNFGPSDDDAVPVSVLADLLVNKWGDGASWENIGDPNAPHEEAYLKLDSSKARQLLGWRPRLNITEAIEWTVAWYKRALIAKPGDEMYEFTKEQIQEYSAR